MQLRFTSLAVTSSWWDFHPQDCAHAGRTEKRGSERSPQIADKPRRFSAGFLLFVGWFDPSPGLERVQAVDRVLGASVRAIFLMFRAVAASRHWSATPLRPLNLA